jgi:pilus assembly protein Flp/PilA
LLQEQLKIFLLEDEDGATAIEYGLIAALIAVSLVASLQAFTSASSEKYRYITETYSEAVNG